LIFSALAWSIACSPPDLTLLTSTSGSLPRDERLFEHPVEFVLQGEDRRHRTQWLNQSGVRPPDGINDGTTRFESYFPIKYQVSMKI